MSALNEASLSAWAGSNDCGKPFDVAELKRLYDSIGAFYGYVLMPSVNGFNMFKIEVGKLRKLVSQAFADNAVEAPVYVAQHAESKMPGGTSGESA